MGTIIHRSDGRYEARLFIDGKRRSFFGKTSAEASDKLLTALQAQREGLPVPKQRLQLGAWLTSWLTEVAAPRLRPNTLRTYKIIVEKHLTPALGSTILPRLQPDAIDRYMNQRLGSGLSLRTVQFHHAVLRRALTVAERRALVTRNVAKLTSPPSVRRPEAQHLSEDQLKTFLGAIKGDRLEALFCLAVCLGPRQGEVLGCTWPDIDSEFRTLKVRHSLQRYGNAYHLDAPKTEKSLRELPIPAPLTALLRAHRTRQIAERLTAGPLWQGDAWNLVFCTEQGSPLYGGWVTRRFQRILKAAGIPRVPFHALRHTSATVMLELGVPMSVVQVLLGHSLMSTTGNIYSHVTTKLKHDAVERTADVLWATS